ncbi:MAG TPA: hypothetical protein VLO11_00915 [Luteolibacter sp.]|nr:hypothetical protein [Luteolibacter sp.]
MRAVIVITLSLLIQMGLFGRVMSEGLCGQALSFGHCHEHDGSHEHSHDDTHHGDENCPPDCGEHHHHHHENCVHGMQLSIFGDCEYRPAPPHAVSLKCDRHHLRAPDGPVMEMDKPPLI